MTSKNMPSKDIQRTAASKNLNSLYETLLPMYDMHKYVYIYIHPRTPAVAIAGGGARDSEASVACSPPWQAVRVLQMLCCSFSPLPGAALRRHIHGSICVSKPANEPGHALGFH